MNNKKAPVAFLAVLALAISLPGCDKGKGEKADAKAKAAEEKPLEPIREKNQDGHADGKQGSHGESKPSPKPADTAEKKSEGHGEGKPAAAKPADAHAESKSNEKGSNGHGEAKPEAAKQQDALGNVKATEKGSEGRGEGKADDKPQPGGREEARVGEVKAEAIEWKDYKLGDSGFAVRFAGVPQCKEQDAGGVKSRVCSASTKETGMMATSAKMAVPAEPARVGSALDSAMKALSASFKGEAVDAVDIVVGDAKGRDFVIKTAQGEVPCRVMIKGQYMAQAIGMARGAASDASRSEAEMFVKSLWMAK